MNAIYSYIRPHFDIKYAAVLHYFPEVNYRTLRLFKRAQKKSTRYGRVLCAGGSWEKTSYINFVCVNRNFHVLVVHNNVVKVKKKNFCK